jgi:hypothetical protein
MMEFIDHGVESSSSSVVHLMDNPFKKNGAIKRI